MTDERSTSELVARVRSALGASGQQEVRGLAALTELQGRVERAEDAAKHFRELTDELEKSEALKADDYELQLVWAPLTETSPGCRYEACESDEWCTCEEQIGGDVT